MYLTQEDEAAMPEGDGDYEEYYDDDGRGDDAGYDEQVGWSSVGHH